MTRTRTAVLLIVLLIPLLASAAFINQKKLIKAAKKGNAAKIEKLLARGADVNAKNKEGRTALMGAAFAGHTAIVQALLEAGADVNAKDERGTTALSAAAFRGHTATVQTLLEVGAEVNARDKNGMTVLMWAAFGAGDHSATVQALLKAGADVDARDKNGGTALKVAAMVGHTDIVKLLENAGTLTTTDAGLIEAARKGETAEVKALLANGADVNAPGQNGMTALFYAALGGHTDIVELLKKAGAKE